MSVSLEPVVPAQEEPAAPPAQNMIIEETPEEPAPSSRSMPEEPPAAPSTQSMPEIPENPNTSEEAKIQAAVAPAPKKRGRPKKDPTVPKATAPKKAVRMKTVQPPTPESSDDDEPLDRDDMETLLLDYLIKRKQTQQDARRNMWAQLAGLR